MNGRIRYVFAIFSSPINVHIETKCVHRQEKQKRPVRRALCRLHDFHLNAVKKEVSGVDRSPGTAYKKETASAISIL